MHDNFGRLEKNATHVSTHNGILRNCLVDFLSVIIELYWQIIMMHKDDKCVDIRTVLSWAMSFSTNFLTEGSASTPPFLHRSTAVHNHNYIVVLVDLSSHLLQ